MKRRELRRIARAGWARALVLLPLVLGLCRGASLDSTGPCRVGLALSGGAALGLAHIGVIKVLEQEGIPACYVSGNSMGSIVGGMYACGYSAPQMDSIVRCMDWNRLFDDQVPENALNLEEKEARARYALNLEHRNLIPELPTGALAAENVYLRFKELTEETSFQAGWDFDSLVLPFRAIAVDFQTGEKIVFRSGSVADAMRASMAIPGVFAPININGRWLVDGGVVQFLPVGPLLEFEPDFIIASDVRQPRDPKHIPGLAEIAWESFDIATERDHEEQMKLADVVIRPDLTGLGAADFGRSAEFIKRGEAAARAALPEIRLKLAGRNPVSRRNQLFPRDPPAVRGISISGVGRSSRRLILRETANLPGKALNLKLLIGDIRRIHQTGFFYQVGYQLMPVAPGIIDVAVNAQERLRGIYSLGIRYDQTNHFLVGGELAQSNLLGSGASVGVGTALGNPTEGWARLSGARFFGLPFIYRVQGFLSSGEHRYYEAGRWTKSYNLREYGADARLGVNLGRNSYFKAGLDARDVFFQPESVWYRTRERIVNLCAEYKIKTFRDYAFPVTGWSFGVRGCYGLPQFGSQYEFLKLELDWRSPFKVGQRLVISPNATAGLMTNGRFRVVPAESLPVAEQFRTGWPDLAGTAFEEFVSPHKLTAGISFQFLLTRVFGSESWPLYAELDCDVASFSNPFGLRGTDQLISSAYYGARAGLRLDTPAGPASVAFGAGRGGRYNAYFSVGYNLLQDFPR